MGCGSYREGSSFRTELVGKTENGRRKGLLLDRETDEIAVIQTDGGVIYVKDRNELLEEEGNSRG